MARELAILVTARNMSAGVFRDVRGDIKGLQSEARRGAQNIARNVGIGMAAAGVGIATQVHAGIQSLVELEEANAQTAAAIKSTGGAAGLTLEDIRKLSEALEDQTTIDDKLIQSGANILLTFRKVSKDAFAPALEVAMDLSTRLGTDLNSAVLQVGKALEDPVRGVTALRRAGVQLNDEQIEHIKTLVEQNDLYGAQQVLLDELKTQVGGSARALAEGAGGAQRRWEDAVEGMQQSLAVGFLPLIEDISERFQNLASDPAFMQRVQGFGETLAAGFERVLGVIEQIPWDTVAGAMEITAGAVNGLLGAFTSLPPWVQTAVISGWGLNKLSGGALGNIVGSLGSGLIKGVLGMNAGVVNINAGMVNGGGGLPGVGGAAGKGGLAGKLGRVAGIGLAVGGGVLVGSQVGSFLNETVGGVGQARSAALDKISAVLDSGDVNRIERAIEVVQDALNPDDFAQSIALGLDVNGVRSTLEEQLSALQSAHADAKAASDAAKAELLRNADTLRSEGDMSRAAIDRVRQTQEQTRQTAERQRLDAAAADISMLGTLSQIRDKATRIDLTVNTTVNVSAAQVQNQISSYRKSSGSGGFI